MRAWADFLSISRTERIVALEYTKACLRTEIIVVKATEEMWRATLQKELQNKNGAPNFRRGLLMDFAVLFSTFQHTLSPCTPRKRYLKNVEMILRSCVMELRHEVHCWLVTIVD